MVKRFLSRHLWRNICTEKPATYAYPYAISDKSLGEPSSGNRFENATMYRMSPCSSHQFSDIPARKHVRLRGSDDCQAERIETKSH
jgi:hypothetical protein